MKKLLLQTICICAFAGTSSAQSTLDVQQWQSQHPDMLLMKKEQFESLPKALQDKITGKVVFYENIATVILEEKSAVANTLVQKEEDLLIIKNWMSQNPDVKIIPRSMYDALPLERQEMYQSIASMILEGETITVRDIQNYQY
jgi:hypothetical protein